MTIDPVVNFGKVVVSLPYDNITTSIILRSGDGLKFPDPSSGAFNLVWWNSTDYPDPSDDPYVEIVRCTGRSIDTLTILRAQEGTLDSNKNTTGKTYNMILTPTKKLVSDLDIVSGSLTVGSILFANTLGKITQDNLNLFWDITNKNLGVGTTVPFAGLSSRHGLDILGSGTYQSLMLYNSGTGGNAWEIISANNADTNIGGKLAFVANNAILGVVTSDGKLGIGTTSPETKLHIEGGSGNPLDDGSYAGFLVSRFKNIGSTNQAYVEVRASAAASCGYLLKGSAATGTSGWGVLTNNSGDLRIAYDAGLTLLKDGTTGMTILTGGNVGIGTNSPGTTLHTNNIVGGHIIRAETSGPNAQIAIKNTYSGTNQWTIGVQSSGSGSVGPNNSFSIRDESVGTRMLIDTNGNVGIGTTNPLGILHINKTSTGTYSVLSDASQGLDLKNWYIESLGSGSIAISAGNDTLTDGRQTIKITRSGYAPTAVDIVNGNFYVENGNVGIGTNSPSVRLDVEGGYFLVGMSSGNMENRFKGANSALTELIFGTQSLPNLGALTWDDTIPRFSLRSLGTARLGLGVNDTEYLTIMSGGNVGIGTISPASKLDINGQFRVIGEGTPVTGKGLEISYSAAGDYADIIAYDRDTSTAKNIRFSQGQTHFMGGNVGIGTTSPGQKLDVAGNINFSGNDLFMTGSIGSRIRAPSGFGSLTDNIANNRFLAWGNDLTGSDAKVNIQPDGKVGIGTNNPLTNLDLNGRFRATSDGISPASGKGTEMYYSTGDDYGVLLAYDRTGGIAKSLRIGSSAPTSLFIKSDGTVGIGTTDTQSVKLRVTGSVALDNNYAMYWRNGANSGYSVGIYSTSADDFRVITGGGDKLTILSSGNVGIGKTPGTLLDVNGITSTVGISNTGTILSYGDIDGSALMLQSDLTKVPFHLAGTVTNASFQVAANRTGVIAALNGTESNYVYEGFDASATPIRTFSVTGTGQLYLAHKSGTIGLDIGSNVTFTGKRLRILGYATTAGTDAGIEISDGGSVYWRFARDSTNNFRMDLSGILGIIGGNVGIGTNSPQDTLHVTSSSNGDIILGRAANTNQAILITRTGSTNTWTVGVRADSTENFYLYDIGAAENRIVVENASVGVGGNQLYLKNGGNVGIGTNNPQQLLDIYSGSGSPSLRLSTTGHFAEIAEYLGYSGNNGGGLLFKARNGNTGSSDTVMAIQGSTNYVGIGTTNPSDLLTIQNTSDAIIRLTKAGVRNWQIKNNGGLDFVDIEGGRTLLHLDNGGNIGIGITGTPDSKLVVSGSGATFKVIETNSSINTVISNLGSHSLIGTISGHSLRIATNNTTAMFIDTNQNVGIGTTNPTSKFQTSSFSAQVTTISSAITLDSTYYTVLCSVGTVFTVTLPDATTCPGRIYNIKKKDSSANAVTIGTTLSQTIDGVTTRVISIQYETVAVQSDGTNWYII